jgi:hypothetical protein
MERRELCYLTHVSPILLAIRGKPVPFVIYRHHVDANGRLGSVGRQPRRYGLVVVQVAAEVGLVGFAVFLAINVRSLLTLYRVSKTPPAQRLDSRDAKDLAALGGLMFLGLVGLLVAGFFISQGYSIFSTLYFALAAAITGI